MICLVLDFDGGYGVMVSTEACGAFSVSSNLISHPLSATTELAELSRLQSGCRRVRFPGSAPINPKH